MNLSLNFAKAILPCIVTGLQSLSPVSAVEPIVLPNSPAAVQVVVNPHKMPNAQIAYAEWRKRLQEAKSEVVIQTYEAAALNGQISASSPAPKHA